MIELRGVNTHNKGAHLMMIAVAEAMGDGTNLSISPNGADYGERSRAGFRQTVLLNQAPKISRAIGNALPGGIRSAFGLTADKEITAVLDAAGFAYSDSFAHTRAKREALLARRWTRRGVPLVMLPQAFGPFEKADQREWSTALLSEAKLIYARDKVSLAHVQELALDSDVRLAPDFTVGLDVSQVPSPFTDPYGALVPNEKLVTQGKVSERAYIDALVAAGGRMQRAGLRPIVVIHEFNDRRIAHAVSDALAAEAFADSSPLVLKRVLRDAEVAVASRFHAVVGALASATPVIAYGWSHKYEELMSDFGVPDWSVKDSSSLPGRVDELLDLGASARAGLQDSAQRVKDANQEMWVDVKKVVLGNNRTSGSSKSSKAG